jgi:hypothetical protein
MLERAGSASVTVTDVLLGGRLMKNRPLERR